jgi:uncharacterized protein YndB with AHSA1/START domain
MIEKQIVVMAPPETIFRIYEDVENWKTWDPDTKASSLNNGLQLGSKGSLTPTKGNTVPMEVTSVKMNHHFTVSSKTAIFRLDFEHELTSALPGTMVTHRVKFAGLLKPLLILMLRPRIDKGLPVTLQRLKALAEATHRSES